jgi:valyl-tRNA synthetase
VVVSQGLEKRLAGKAFLDKAPKELVESTRAALNEKTEQLATVNKSIQDLA